MAVVLSLIGLTFAVGGAVIGRQIAPDQTLPFPNGDFAHDLDSWTVAPADNGISSVGADRADATHKVLKIADDMENGGSDITGPHIPVAGTVLLELRGRVYPISGSGLGVYIVCYDKNGKPIGDPAEHQRTLPAEPHNQWASFSLQIVTPGETESVAVWVHSYKKDRVSAYLSDFTMVKKPGDFTRTPWPPQYKIHPNETSRLTEADVVGPDGIVYPDWRYAGVPGGIPGILVRANVSEYGATPGDDKDDSDAIERGLADVGAKGGGALQLAPGVYDLDRPIVCEKDGVVLRGSGIGKTIIRFRYGGAAPGHVQFYRPLADSVVDPSSWIEIHADPTNLRYLEFDVDGKRITSKTYTVANWGGTFSIQANAASVVSSLMDGPHTFTAIGTYADGHKVTQDLKVTTSHALTGQVARTPVQIGAIMFNGPSQPGPKLLLAKDAKRGERTLTLASVDGLHPGDSIVLDAPATPRWNALTHNACKWGDYRRYEFRVESIAGMTVRVNQPLRLDFPTIDGSFVTRVGRMRHCGVEDLTLEQTKELWTSGIVFSNAWECWARNVDVKKAGRFPLYFLHGKWNEIDNCSMEDVWYHGGGGTGYVGWEYSCDCLMQSVHTVDMRHAPCVQWSASGNVIRNSTFINSDAQWHSGWTNENLFENCVIQSARGDRNGGYGYGMWGSFPADTNHGPNGPRNVVYNCDSTSQKSGIWMGGMNEGWLIVGNRFVVGSGAGVYAKEASFDHILQDNVFVLRDPKSPLLLNGTPNCTGTELRGNTVYGGSGALAAGQAKPVVSERNRLMPGIAGGAIPPRPILAVPSIFDWERRNKAVVLAR